jgi:FtsH-binding integral membrane protein
MGDAVGSSTTTVAAFRFNQSAINETIRSHQSEHVAEWMLGVYSFIAVVLAVTLFASVVAKFCWSRADFRAGSNSLLVVGWCFYILTLLVFVVPLDEVQHGSRNNVICALRQTSDLTGAMFILIQLFVNLTSVMEFRAQCFCVKMKEMNKIDRVRIFESSATVAFTVTALALEAYVLYLAVQDDTMMVLENTPVCMYINDTPSRSSLVYIAQCAFIVVLAGVCLIQYVPMQLQINRSRRELSTGSQPSAARPALLISVVVASAIVDTATDSNWFADNSSDWSVPHDAVRLAVRTTATIFVVSYAIMDKRITGFIDQLLCTRANPRDSTLTQRRDTRRSRDASTEDSDGIPLQTVDARNLTLTAPGPRQATSSTSTSRSAAPFNFKLTPVAPTPTRQTFSVFDD